MSLLDFLIFYQSSLIVVKAVVAVRGKLIAPYISIIRTATNVFCTSLCKREARHFKPTAAGQYTAYQEWVPYRSPLSKMPSPSTEISFSAVWREQLFPFFTAVTVQRESPDRSAISVTESPLRTCSTANMILSILIFKFLRSLAFANFIIDKAKAKVK